MREKKAVLRGRSVVKGVAQGTALVTKQSFGFTALLDPNTGLVIDKKHELHGKKITDKVLCFPYGKGSTNGAIYFLEAVRCGNVPAAIINIETEPIIASGAIMAEIFYKKRIPIVDKTYKNPFEIIHTGDHVKVDGNKGLVEVTPRGSKRECRPR